MMSEIFLVTLSHTPTAMSICFADTLQHAFLDLRWWKWCVQVTLPGLLSLKTDNNYWPLLSFKRDQRAKLAKFFLLNWHKCWPGRIPTRAARNHQGSNVQLCTPFVKFHWAKLEWKVKARQSVSPSLWYHCPKRYWPLTQISAKKHIQHHNSSQHEIFHSLLASSTSKSPCYRLLLYHDMNTQSLKLKEKPFWINIIDWGAIKCLCNG